MGNTRQQNGKGQPAVITDEWLAAVGKPPDWNTIPADQQRDFLDELSPQPEDFVIGKIRWGAFGFGGLLARAESDVQGVTSGCRRGAARALRGDGLAVFGVITGRVFEDCPDLCICFSHGGGAFTQILLRLQYTWQNGGALRDELLRSPAEYVQLCYYDDTTYDNRALRYLIDTVGVSQVMGGSDYAFGGGPLA